MPLDDSTIEYRQLFDRSAIRGEVETQVTSPEALALLAGQNNH